MNRFLTFLLLGCMTHSHAQQIDERWYWNINAGAIVPDDSLQLNDAHIYDFRVGKSMNYKWSYEIQAFTDEYDFDIDYGLKHQGLAVNFLNINHDPLWKPYFLIGAGFIYHESPLDSGTNLFFNVGVGASWYFFGDNIRLRAEAVSRLDLNDTELPGQDGFGDGIFSVGLTVPIGN
ncbi:MAG: outer membrane beta-barrel protein [Marinicellaceae bacterium]